MSSFHLILSDFKYFLIRFILCVQGHSAHGKCPAVKTVPGKVRIKAVGNTLSPDMTCCCEDTPCPISDTAESKHRAPFCFVGNKME